MTRQISPSVNIPANLDPQLTRTLQAIKETLEITTGQRGRPLDRAPTLGELVDVGLLISGPGGIRAGNNSYKRPNFSTDQSPVTGPPPKPENVVVTASSRYIYISFDSADVQYAEIYAQGPSPSIIAHDVQAATLRATAYGSPFVQLYAEPDQYYRIYVRFIGFFGQEGPWHDIEGTEVLTELSAGEVYDQVMQDLAQVEWTPNSAIPQISTGVDIDGRRSLLIAADRVYFVPEDPEVEAIAPFVIDTVNNRVVIDGAYMKEASIDEASIIELTADKITSGTLQGVIIQGNDIRGGVLSLGLGLGSFGPLNARTYMDSNGNAFFGGQFLLESNPGGAGVRISEEKIEVRDVSGTIRVEIGDLG